MRQKTNSREVVEVPHQCPHQCWQERVSWDTTDPAPNTCWSRCDMKAAAPLPEHSPVQG